MVLALKIQTVCYEIFYMISAHIMPYYRHMGLILTSALSQSTKTQKKEQGQYQAILTGQAWSIKGLLYGQKITPKNFTFAGIK